MHSLRQQLSEKDVQNRKISKENQALQTQLNEAKQQQALNEAKEARIKKEIDVYKGQFEDSVKQVNALKDILEKRDARMNELEEQIKAGQSERDRFEEL